MRFIVTCSLPELEKRPSNSVIKRALNELGFNNVSVVFVNNENILPTVSHPGQGLDNK